MQPFPPLFKPINLLGSMSTGFRADLLNLLLGLQVAKALLESAAKSRTKLQRPDLRPEEALTPSSIQELLQFRSVQLLHLDRGLPSQAFAD